MPRNTNTQFALDQIAQFAEDTGEAINETVRAGALDVFSEIVANTPVSEKDGGFLRGNWQCDVGASPNSILDTRDPQGSQTQANIVRAVSQYDGDADIFLTNNAPYSEVAELGLWGQGEFKTDRTVNGFSRQAPQGIVAPVVERFSQAIERASRRNRI